MIPKEIIKNYGLKEEYKNDWLKGTIKLPERTFVHFFKEINSYFFNICVQNYYNDDVIDRLLVIVESEVKNNKFDFSTFNITKLNDFENFDILAFFPFEFTVSSSSGLPNFDKKHIRIYPMYNYELIGTTKKIIKNVVRIVPIIEWSREPKAVVSYKFQNPKHKYGTRGISVNWEDNVYSALKKFETNDCFMEVQNYKEDKLRIVFIEDKQKFVIDKFSNEVFEFKEIKSYLYNFFRGKSKILK